MGNPDWSEGQEDAEIGYNQRDIQIISENAARIARLSCLELENRHLREKIETLLKILRKTGDSRKK